MGEIKFIAGLVMFALFSIAITTYAISFANDNNAAVDLGNDSKFVNLNTQIKENVTKFSITDVNDSSTAFFTSTIEAGDETMGGGGAFKVGLSSVLGSVSSLMSVTKTYLFGGSNLFGIFLAAISGLLLYTGIRYVYKTWVGKNPD